MKPPGHAIISLTIGGGLWGVTKSPYSLVSAFLTGVMIDIDHLPEFYRWFVKGDNTKVWFFFHSYELLVPVFLAGYLSGWEPVVLGISFAFLGHLLTDQLTNPVRPLTYFFTYRASKGFRRSEIIHVQSDDTWQVLQHRSIIRTILWLFNPRFKTRK